MKAISHQLTILKSQLQNLMIFKDARGNVHFRIKHNRIDKPYYEEITYLGIKDNEKEFDIKKYEFKNYENLLEQAFQYFLKKTTDLSNEELSDLKDVILHCKLQVKSTPAY